MKKLLTAASIVIVSMTACSDSTTTTTTTSTDTAGSKSETNDAMEVQNRAKQISDSTKMLDKKLADPNSKYSPDSLK